MERMIPTNSWRVLKNWQIYSNRNCLRHIWIKYAKFIIISFVFIIILISSLTNLFANYYVCLPVSLISQDNSIWNNAHIKYNIHHSKNIVSKNNIRNISKFRCTGDENNIDTWPERLCVFNNICYNVQTQGFEYYQRSHTPKFPLFYDSVRGMLSEFSLNKNGRGFVSLTTRGGESWAPFVINQTCPSTNVTWLTNLHTLWREYSQEHNFGHLVWEDIASIFYSMERMNEFDEQLMIMHINPIPQHPKFKNFLDNIFPAITSQKLMEYKSYSSMFNTKYICFKRFMAGGNIHFFLPMLMKEIHGRESLLYKWRSAIIKYHKFDPEYIPQQHRIIFTNKTATIAPKGSSGTRRTIANLKEVVTFVKSTYPNIPVEVIEWHNLSFYNQLALLLKTTIFISPPGGVSMIAPFLPHGSHAIIMDYYVTKPHFGFAVGSSASMEGMLLNHFPHFKKDYYQIYGKQDYVLDYPGADDTRDYASTIVNLTRLHLLIESAMEDMNL